MNNREDIFVKTPLKQFEKEIIKWNSRFRYDRFFRKKYNIAFNSPEHRGMNQIDIFFELFEDQVFDRIITEDKEHKAYLETGVFLKDRLSDVTEKEFENLSQQFREQWIQKSE